MSPVKPYHSKALPEGAILREWRLEGILGVGGFGIVYRAKGVYFGETVAIKEYFPSAICDRNASATVAPTDSASEEVYALGLEKFVEEAKVLWNLSKPDRHPNIVSVRSLFEAHGTAYLVMDFETGVPLSELLRAGRRFEEAELLALLRPIADGLDRAHRAGILHRDIKPANILIDDGGRPVLIDFGSARFDAGQATSTKVTFYTPPYAALEQYVKTYPQGPWTDIYALGVALYQCVTGEKPPEVLERLHAQSGEALSARQRPGFSRSFTRAVDAAMAIRPAERPQSIPEWLTLFEQSYDDDDEVTRIGVPNISPSDEDATRVIGLRSEPLDVDPAAVIRQPPPPAIEPKNQDPTGGLGSGPPARRWVIPQIGIGVVAVVAAAGTLLMARSHVSSAVGRMLPTAPLAAFTTAPAKPVAPSRVFVPTALENDAKGFVSEAQRFGRPTKEIEALVGAQARIAYMAGQIRTSAEDASDAATTATMLAALNTQATVMSRNESAALGAAAEGQLREVEQALGRSRAGRDSSAIAAVIQAKAKLDATIAAAPSSGNPVDSIDAARQALGDYDAFARTYIMATRLHGPAKRSATDAHGPSISSAFVAHGPVKRSAFVTVEARAREIGNATVALSAVPRPWLFASQARKQAYRLLQDNSVRSKALVAQLDELSRMVSANNDREVLESAAARGLSIQRELSNLYAASTAARSIP